MSDPTSPSPARRPHRAVRLATAAIAAASHYEDATSWVVDDATLTVS